LSPFNIQKNGNYSLSNYGDSIYLFPYARNAFFEALKKLNIKTIYMPGFICRDMLAPINSLNIKYYFYEVNKNLQPILEDIECDAILFVNYFGFEQEIKPFNEYKAKFGAILIEDNAHGFLSKDMHGLLLGTRGDIGLLSIRKTISLPNGGALVINNIGYKKIIFKSAMVQKSFEDDNYNKKLSIKKKIFSKYLGITILLLRRFIRYIKTGSIVPLSDKNSEKYMPKNLYLTPLLEDKIVNIDIDYEVNRRRLMYNKIKIWAEVFCIKPIFELDKFSCPFEFAFIDNGNYQEFEAFLLKKGFFILPWPDLPDNIVNNCSEFYKNIKVVPFLW